MNLLKKMISKYKYLIGTIINKLDMDQYIDVNADYDYFQNERYVKKNTKKN